MARKLSIGVCVLVSAALFAAIAPAAQAANTWEGVWDSDFGRLTMSASGAGSYEGFSPGTISGPAVGDVNEGTWDQGGDPPRRGPYRFVLSGGGQSFTGTWSYEQGGCGSACGWNGTCIEGACTKNGVTGGGGGGSCQARSGDFGLFAPMRDALCPGAVKFKFSIRDGFPDSPDEKHFPETLLGIAAKGSGVLVPKRRRGDERYEADGEILLKTEYFGLPETLIELIVHSSTTYTERGKLRRIDLGGPVGGTTTDPSCQVANANWSANFAVKEERANFRLGFYGSEPRCLSDKPLLWKTKRFQKASITVVK